MTPAVAHRGPIVTRRPAVMLRWMTRPARRDGRPRWLKIFCGDAIVYVARVRVHPRARALRVVRSPNMTIHLKGHGPDQGPTFTQVGNSSSGRDVFGFETF